MEIEKHKTKEPSTSGHERCCAVVGSLMARTAPHGSLSLLRLLIGPSAQPAPCCGAHLSGNAQHIGHCDTTPLQSFVHWNQITRWTEKENKAYIELKLLLSQASIVEPLLWYK